MNIKRHLRFQKKQAAKKAQQKIEKLAAAFLQETGLPPSKARLCQSTGVSEAGTPTVYYWFEELTERANIADSHPDVQFLFDVLFAFNEARKNDKLTEVIPEFSQMVDEFMQKYEQETNHVFNSPIPAQEQNHAAEEEGGRGQAD
jgi:hypothetical protein